MIKTSMANNIEENSLIHVYKTLGRLEYQLDHLKDENKILKEEIKILKEEKKILKEEMNKQTNLIDELKEVCNKQKGQIELLKCSSKCCFIIFNYLFANSYYSNSSNWQVFF
jgi:hypothetical protein